MHVTKNKLFTITSGSLENPGNIAGIFTDARHLPQKMGVLRLTVYKDNQPVHILESDTLTLLKFLVGMYKFSLSSLKHEE